jgi:hypothetical protein
MIEIEVPGDEGVEGEGMPGREEIPGGQMEGDIPGGCDGKGPEGMGCPSMEGAPPRE